MTDLQTLALALAVLAPLSLLLLSNSRIGDARKSLDGRIIDARETLRVEMQKGHTQILAGLERITALIETKFKIHGLEHQP